jgi:hemolysin activation/secretion protein
MKYEIKYPLLFGLISLICMNNLALADSATSTISNIAHNGALEVDKMSAKIKDSKVKKLKKKRRNLNLNQFSPYKLNKVIIESDIDNKELYLIANEYVGKEFTPNELNKLNHKMLSYYFKQGYLVPLIHNERIGDAKEILKISVKAAIISNVILVGEGGNDKLIKEYANKILAPTAAKVDHTQRYLGLMNKVVGYDISYALKPKKSNINPPFQEEVDLVIYTSAKKKLGAYADVDNNINKDFGNIEISGLVQFFSPLKLDESIAINALTSDEPNKLYGVGLDYRQPINAEGTNFNLYSSHSQDNAAGNSGVSLSNNKLSMVKFAFSHYLLLRQNHELEIEAAAQYWNSINYNSTSTLPDNNSSKDNFWVASAGAKYITNDRFGGNNLANLIVSTNLGGSHSNYVNSSATPNTNFNLIQANHYREQNLANNFSFFSHLAGIYSKVNIPDQLDLAIGGKVFGRGYQPFLINTNKALALALEGRYNYKVEHILLNNIQPYLFVDMAGINKQNANINASSLGSGGLGLRFFMKDQLNLGMEVGIPFRKNLVINNVTTHNSTRFNFFLSKSLDY